MSEQSPAQPQYQPAPPLTPGTVYAPPPEPRRSPVLGYVALGIAALGLVIGIVEQIVQRLFLLRMHYSGAAFGLFSGVSVTVGILFNLVVIALAVVAVVGRRGTIPAAIALGAGGFALISTLGSLLVTVGMSYTG